jgi:hypothetical protein
MAAPALRVPGGCKPWPENVSHMTGAEMEVEWERTDGSISKTEVLVAHLTSVDFGNLIFSERSHGLRASTQGQGGGGLTVVCGPDHGCVMTALGWDRYQGGKFRPTAGQKLWGAQADRVLEGGPDADKLDLVFFIAVPKVWIENAVAVPGRKLIKIITPDLLQERGGCHYCPLNKLKRVYILKRGVEAVGVSPAPAPASKVAPSSGLLSDLHPDLRPLLDIQPVHDFLQSKKLESQDDFIWLDPEDLDKIDQLLGQLSGARQKKISRLWTDLRDVITGFQAWIRDGARCGTGFTLLYKFQIDEFRCR